MALRLEKLTKFGITAEYWQIHTIQINHKTKQAAVTLRLFKDANSTDGVTPFEVRNYMFQGNQYPFELAAQATNNVIALGYIAIKSNDTELSEAEDV